MGQEIRTEKRAVFDDLLREEREFPPPKAFAARALVKDHAVYEQAAKDPQKYWEGEAKLLHWFKPWSKVLDWSPPHARWFVGGQLNLSYNCLDRHLEGPRRNKAALIWEGENGDTRTLTYQQLHREVCKFANCLKDLGVTKGDRVAIYMPLLMETAVAMLACARIGAIHNVVFGGFSPDALADRINDSKAKVLITADGGWRRGTVVPLKHNSDRALESCPSIQHVIIVKNLPGEPHLLHIHEGRDHWYHRLMDHQTGRLPGGPRGFRRHAVHPLHLGNDGKAQGHCPCDGRLCSGGSNHGTRRVRPQGRGHFLVLRRRGVGDGPQLRGLRPSSQRRHRPHVRRGSGLSRKGPFLGAHRATPGERVLHGAHLHPLLHEVG